MTRQRAIIALGAVLTIKALLALAYIAWGPLNLGPDEAQYWTWSQQLAWGYYSKPPGIAWQIWLGTQIFGNTELGVRFFCVVIAMLLSIATCVCARWSGQSWRVAFWAGTLVALTPFGFAATFLATTDWAFFVFWTLTCGVVARALSRGECPNYFIVGLLIALGALWKWPIYSLWGFIIGGAVLIPHWRRLSLVGGMAVSLLGLLPSVAWNASNNWATFRHVASTVVVPAGKATAWQGNPFEFLGVQMLLVSPIIFVFLGMALLYLVRHWKEVPPAIRWCGCCCGGIVLVHCMLSFTKKLQGNWCLYAYPPGMVITAWYVDVHLRKWRWLKAAVAINVVAGALIFALPVFQERGVSYGANAFRHLQGWRQLDAVLQRAGYRSDRHALLSDRYQTSSLLSFYGPQQRRAYLLNLFGARKNQFSFWPSLAEERRGQTVFFVWAENCDRFKKTKEEYIHYFVQNLQPYFRSVTLVASEPLLSFDEQSVKEAWVFRCEGYNGGEPEEVSLY